MKEPKWKTEWDRLVGDHKHFEIKNWAKYQPEMEDGTSNPWFKSYVTTDEDALAEDETGLMRWLKDALRRFRTRRGSPLPTNMRVLLMGTSCHVTDRPHLPTLVLRLVSRGFLIPCNESFTPKSRGDKKREEKKRQAPPSPEKTEAKIESAASATAALKRMQGIVPLKHRALLDWDEDVVGIPADMIRRAIRWKWKQGDSTWIRTKCSPGWVRKNAEKLVDDVPPSEFVPKYESKPDPNCAKCSGSGNFIEEDGLYQTSVTCFCVQQVEVG